MVDLKTNTFISEWKSEVKDILKLSGIRSPDREIDIFLDDIVENCLDDKRVILVNNYTNTAQNSTILELFNTIENSKLVCAGGGCLYLPHHVKENLMSEFILDNMDTRSNARKELKKFPEDSYDFYFFNMLQLATKLIINSLYGCNGYPGFAMFNVFNAEAITNGGRRIITSAINVIETFVSGSIYCTSMNEVLHVINNISKEFDRNANKFPDKAIDKLSFNLDISKLPEIVLDRYIQIMKFHYTKEDLSMLLNIFRNMNTSKLLLMYYKNNFIEFTKLPIITDKIVKFISMFDIFLKSEVEELDADTDSFALLNNIAEMYEFFVLYNYPIHDKIRKAMYFDKDASLYTDTDSVFYSLNKLVSYTIENVFDISSKSENEVFELKLSVANIGVCLVNKIIAKALYRLCVACNIPDDKAKLLAMKNEALIARIMFMEAKKRYVGNIVMDEGKYVAKEGKGKSKFRGYDFLKSTTKPFVRDYYKKICNEDILYPSEIDLSVIFDKLMVIKNDIITAIESGNEMYFKQANVKDPMHYKRPYSTQGVMATLLWNSLCPDLAIELPSDINIVPIKPLTFAKIKEVQSDKVNRTIIKTPMDNKNVADYAGVYNDKYQLLYKNIYTNLNPDIRHMTLTSIAIPKNMDVEIPDHVMYLIDKDKLINDTTGLFLPIMKNLGFGSFKVSSNVEVMSNIISL